MIRLIAMMSYVYQSVTAVMLIFGVSHILTAPDYTSFSLALASSQFLSVFAFEWVQLAGIRFLSSSDRGNAAIIKTSLFTVEFLSAGALLAVGTIVAVSRDLPAPTISLGLAIAILQGMTDLHFMMIRVSGQLGLAAVLMIMRASLLLLAALLGALHFGSAEGALLGMLAGQLAALVLGSVKDRSLLQWRPLQTDRSYLIAFCRYGMLAAGASVTHLSIPIVIRIVVVNSFGVTNPASAGFSMALDIMQRPYNVLVSAIHTVNYPDVVAHFDRSSQLEAKRAAARLFEFVICSTILLFGGLIGILPDLAWIVVPEHLRASFLAVEPSAATFFFLHTHLQATLAVVPHLQKAALRLVLVAFGQLICVSVFVLAIVTLALPPTMSLWGAALATSILIVCASGPTLRFGAAPDMVLTFTAIVGGATIGALVFLPSTTVLSVAAKCLLAVLIVLLVTWKGKFLSTPRPLS